MLIRTWSRLRSQAVWALALIVVVPAVAEAQQTGLFPLRPIRRERVPCAAEDPVYRMHREQYYGYFPTCWRRFPPGWGCLSPEAPDPAASFKQYQRTPPPDYRSDEEPDGGMGTDDRDLGPRRGGDTSPNPSPLPPPPAGGRDLFQLDSPKPGNSPATPPPSNPSDLPAPGAPANRSTPSIKPSSSTARPASAEIGLAPREAPTGPGAGEPLLALPEPPAAGAPPAPVINPLPSVDAPAGAMSDPAPALPTDVQPQPEQAPQRRSLLGSLFGGLRRR
ncbi:MAG: hypothetical protein P4L84_23110 [Isosphaeraceae bacterium]|nr:hypothetical protein [Isosphaeraceae bacterium]